MRNRTLFLIFLLIIASGETFACICGQSKTLAKLADTYYQSSNIILVGEVIQLDTSDHSSTIIVSELFKGDIKTDTLKIKYFDSCSLIPESGRWLIYAQMTNGSLNISQCSPSRSFLKPERVTALDYNYPVPPKNVGDEDWKQELNIQLLEYRRMALGGLIDELETLRKK